MFCGAPMFTKCRTTKTQIILIRLCETSASLFSAVILSSLKQHEVTKEHNTFVFTLFSNQLTVKPFP